MRKLSTAPHVFVMIENSIMMFFDIQLFSPQNPRQVTPFPSFSCNKLLDEYVYGIHLYPIMTLQIWILILIILSTNLTNTWS